jgi:hypothetical protein
VGSGPPEIHAFVRNSGAASGRDAVADIHDVALSHDPSDSPKYTTDGPRDLAARITLPETVRVLLAWLTAPGKDGEADSIEERLCPAATPAHADAAGIEVPLLTCRPAQAAL